MIYYNQRSVRECFRKIHGIDAVRILYGSITAVATTIGIILCLLFLAIFYVKRKKLRSTTYKLFLSLNTASMLLYFTDCTIMLPCTFTDCGFYTDLTMVSLAWTNTFGYNAAACTNLLLSFERFSMFYFQTVHRLIDRHKFLFLLLPWIYSAIITIGSAAMGCHKRWDIKTILFDFFFSATIIFFLLVVFIRYLAQNRLNTMLVY